MTSKKVYKIVDKKTGKHVSLGYKSKSSWLTFPDSAIKNSRLINEDDFYVEEYQLVLKKKLTISRKEIK